jgi:hypothetical protein
VEITSVIVESYRNIKTIDEFQKLVGVAIIGWKTGFSSEFIETAKK